MPLLLEASAITDSGNYIVMMLLFSIPVVGWIACIIMSVASKNRNRRNFAKAMLVFLIIGIVLAVIGYFLFSWVWEVVVEYAQGYISETTGGAVSGLDELKDLTNILGGLDLSALPGQ